MDEQQILKQLNSLSEEVKPREKWVNLTKKELLNSQQQKAAATLISKAFSPLQKPVMALAALGLIALTMGSAMFYSPQLVKIDEPMPRISNDDAQLAASVEKLDTSLKQINEKLANLEKSKDPIQALAMTIAIDSMAEQGQTAIGEMTTTASSFEDQTLASLSQGYNQLEESNKATQSNIIEALFKGFDKNKEFLSKEKQSKLERARKAYEEGRIEPTIIILQQLRK